MKHNIVRGKDKGTIVFIHGNSSSSNVFKKVMQSVLITQTKIAVDLPGHGNNLDYTQDEDFSVKSYRDKLISFLNQIDDDILLVGNSLGGHLAIEISNYVSRLKGLIIFGTPPIKKPINLQEAFLPVDALQTFFNEDPTESEIIDAANKMVFKKEYSFNIIEDFKSTNPKVRKAILMDITENKFSDQLELFTNLKVPRYIIAGKNDCSVNFQYLKDVKNKCNGFCDLITFDECGHYPSLEKPEEFTNALKIIANKVF